MNAFKFLRNLYLCHFSKPAGLRPLWRLLCQQPVLSIVEIGVGRLDRTRRMLNLALQKTPAEQLKYAGLDLFDARHESQPPLALKHAHKELKPLGIKAQLVPGDAFSGLARCANGLTKTDLLIIGQEMQGEELTKAWFFVPRMLHDATHVFLEVASSKPGETELRKMTRVEIEQLASVAARGMRKAA